MRYGRGAMNKYEYGCTIAVQPGLSAAAAAGRGGLRGLRRRRPHDRAPADASGTTSIRSSRPWKSASPRNKTDLYPILREVAETYPRRGMMVLVSDLLVEREGLFRGLKLLRSRGHDVMVFHVLDDDELDFPFTGPTRFEGLETARAAALQSPALARGLPGGAARPTWRRSAAAARGTTSTTPCCGPASRWTPPWPPS